MRSLVPYENPVTDLLDSFFSNWSPRQILPGFFEKNLEGNLVPSVDVEETETGYLVKTDLPGLTKEDININVEDGVMTISGEKKRETEKKDKHYSRYERSYGKFSRSFSLPNNVDSKKVEAKYHNGVLVVTLTKTEGSKPRGIEVKVQ
jgi:HSP20 family protein